MNKRPIDKTKKSNIKCEHCMFFAEDKNANIVCNNNECTNADSPKYGKSGLNYWNRCKQFEWSERCNESEVQGMSDLISRQAVFDLMRSLTRWCVRSEDGKFNNVGLLYDDVMFGIDKLPSVNPQEPR